MDCSIEGKEYLLSQIFDNDFEFHMPAYQRPYVWTEAEASELFQDLYLAFDTNPNDNYFLGSIVLVKKEKGNPYAEVIDGQQRLTTLTILFALLAHLFPQSDAYRYIKSEKIPSQNIQEKPRLTLREAEKKFFEKYILDLDNIEKLFQLPKSELKTEAQKHIQENAQLFYNKITGEPFYSDAERISTFVQFLVTKCCVIAVTSSSEPSAFHVFSVLNNRGMQLLPCDILKAEIIGKIPRDEQKDYTEKWETIESQTGREQFNDLFSHIRMIFSRHKQQTDLVDEFKTHVLGGEMTSEKFINDILAPYAEAFRILTKSDYQSSENADKVNGYLRWLNKIDNTDWLPPAIRYFIQHTSPEETLRFVKKLERRAAFMYICSKNVNYRIDRYSKIIEMMQQNKPWEQSIDLFSDEINQMRNVLGGNIFEDLPSSKRNYLILRLDSFVSDGAAQYTPATLTIEHVLPQNPAQGSQWMRWWPDQEIRENWTHKIANLVPLTRSKNSSAQNYDFDRKKDQYLSSNNNTSSYALTTQVLHESEWTPAVLEKRQQMLLDKLSEKWELNILPNTFDLFDTSSERKKNFKFSNYGIPVGAELSFFRNPSIKCIVLDGNNKVEYNGAIYSLSKLARILLSQQSGRYWKAAQGAAYFQYQGKKLSDMPLLLQKNE